MKTRKHHYKVLVNRSFLHTFKQELDDKIKEMPKTIPYVLQKYTNHSDTSNPPQLSNQFLDLHEIEKLDSLIKLNLKDGIRR